MAEPWSLAASWLWERREDIAKKLDETYRWLRGKRGQNRKILIIGPGGVGKSTLAQILSGRYRWLTDDPWKYESSLGVDEFELTHKPKTEIVVLPGQVERRNIHLGPVKQQLARGEFRGIIYVGCFGYHSIVQSSYREHPLFNGRKDAWLESHLAHSLQDELTYLAEITSSITASEHPIWFLTLVTKQDVWWPSRDDCTAHYTQGAYRQTLDRLKARLGENRFNYEQHPASLTISNFKTDAGEIICKNAAGYDHEEQMKSVRRLLEIVHALLDWEKRR